MRLLYIIFSLFFIWSYAISEDTAKRVCHAERLSADPPKIDGRLNDQCWADSGWTGNFIQQQPNEGQPGTERTEFKILYDNSNLYVGIRAHDSEPDKMDIRFSRRDNFDGDCAGICFDSYNDHKTGYEFNLNASGSKIDLMQMDSGGEWSIDTNWDAVWDGKTAVNDSGWTAEYRIPFSQLRFTKKDSYTWGLHVWRWINRKMEESQFQLIPLDSQGRVHRFGILEGIRDIPNPKHIELLPYSRVSQNRFKPDPNNPFTREGHSWSTGLGLDGKIGIAGNLNLDFTLNPDFGQVEADPSVVNLTAFETFYEEKRPFFMEGRQMFNFDIDDQDLFYSRRIGGAPGYNPVPGNGEYIDTPKNSTILGAVKLTGKTASGWSIGLLSGLTQKESAKITGPSGTSIETVEPLTNYSVARLQRDFAKGNHSLGVIFTSVQRQIGEEHLNFIPESAYSGGVDGTIQWGNRTYYLNAKGVFSQIRGHKNAIARLQQSAVHNFQRTDASHLEVDSSRTSLTGSAGEFEIGRGGNGCWRFEESFAWRSPGLELNDIGYLQHADIIKQSTDLAYVVTEPSGILNNYDISMEQSNHWTFNKEFIYAALELSGSVRFTNFWSMHGYIERETDRLHPYLLRGGPAMRLPDITTFHYHLLSDSRKRLQGNIGYFQSIFNDNVSAYWNLLGEVYWRITDKLDISLTPSYSENRDNWQYITTEWVDTSPRYILGQINQKTMDLTIRLNFYVTPELSIQYYGQPFISAGRFSDLKQVTDSKADHFEDRYAAIEGEKILNIADSDDIVVDENIDGLSDYRFDNPDFNVQEFRSNFILRWEYRPGSTLYIVWTHNRSHYNPDGSFQLTDDFKTLFSTYPGNTFLVKLNYWFSF